MGLLSVLGRVNAAHYLLAANTACFELRARASENVEARKVFYGESGSKDGDYVDWEVEVVSIHDVFITHGH